MALFLERFVLALAALGLLCLASPLDEALVGVMGRGLELALGWLGPAGVEQRVIPGTLTVVSEGAGWRRNFHSSTHLVVGNLCAVLAMLVAVPGVAWGRRLGWIALASLGVLLWNVAALTALLLLGGAFPGYGIVLVPLLLCLLSILARGDVALRRELPEA